MLIALDRPLVLASTSPYRAQVLARLGLPFAQAAPVCDEAALAREEPIPTRLVWELARRKAVSLRDRFPDALLLGGDQVAVIGDRVLGKPGTDAAAVEQLAELAGREHRLLTAVALCDARSGRMSVALEVHRMRLRPLGRAALERYVAHDRPLDCAGSYRIEAAGPLLFESVEGTDPTAIMGLPLSVVARLLEKFRAGGA